MLTTFALLAAIALDGQMEYRCTSKIGETRYSDKLCEQDELCAKWGAGGFKEEHCASEFAAQGKREAQFAEANRCRGDVQCWSEKAYGSATSDCREQVETRAKYQFRWEDGWLESKFDHVQWFDRAKGYVTYSGDHISMQNGFGAWQRMRYHCVYDPEARRVIGPVEITPR